MYSVGSDMVRLQCAFVDTPEVESVSLTFIGNQRRIMVRAILLYRSTKGMKDLMKQSNSFVADDLDEMFEEAARLVVQSSTWQHFSMIQRRLKLGIQ
jgi:S-DNA-T family DNA segregation ATPase FtsK/SpoIIIE